MNTVFQTVSSILTSRKQIGRIRHLCVAACITLTTITAIAVPSDPPSRVGRVGYVEGDVSFYADRSEGWRKARINFPVTSENSIWTENQSRAEIRIGASALRVDDNSVLDFIKINDDRTYAFLQRGTVNIRTRSDNNENGRDSVRLDTNEGQFTLEGNGSYRIDTSQDGLESRIAVFVGRARYASKADDPGNDNRFNIDAGKTLIVRNSGAGTNSDFHFENANDSAFDRWAASRDQSWDESHIRYSREQTISPYMTGYEDLDTYGDWIEDREYGHIWSPRVVVSGWAPYRYGSWSYVRPWGWTWVDDAAWGFAPFHYGRWVYAGSRWAWWPGDYVRRPVYAPALVGWYGRPDVNISISVGSGPSIGWFPLAPREYYVPSYTNNITYIRNINHITNNITVINPPTTYANQMPGATFVSGNAFVNSRPVQNNTVKLTTRELSEHPIASAPSAAPFPKEMGSRAFNGNPANTKLNAANPAMAPAPATTPAPAFATTPSPKSNYAPGIVPNFGKPVPQTIKGGPLPAAASTPMPSKNEMTSRASPQPSFTKSKSAQPAEASARLPNTANSANAASPSRGNNPPARTKINIETGDQMPARQSKQHQQEARATQEGRVPVLQHPVEKAPKPAPPQLEKREQPAEGRVHQEAR